MRFIPIIALIAVITGAVPRAGPDFAGVWKLDRSLSDPSGPGKDVTLTVSQEGDALILVREVEARSIEARYDLAGRPTENILPSLDSVGRYYDTFHNQALLNPPRPECAVAATQRHLLDTAFDRVLIERRWRWEPSGISQIW